MPVPGNRVIFVADASAIQMLVMAALKLPLFSLPDVLHVPKLSTNLLSIYITKDLNCKITYSLCFSGQDHGNKIGFAKKRNRLYYFEDTKGYLDG